MRALALLPLLLLAACGTGGSANGDTDRQLNDAAARIDANAVAPADDQSGNVQGNSQ